jgi:hypothetical protein
VGMHTRCECVLGCQIVHVRVYSPTADSICVIVLHFCFLYFFVLQQETAAESLQAAMSTYLFFPSFFH